MPLLQKETFPPLSEKQSKFQKTSFSTSYDLSLENFEKHEKKISWQRKSKLLLPREITLGTIVHHVQKRVI